MRLEEMRTNLQNAMENYERVESIYQKQLKKEIKLVRELLDFLDPVLPKKEINGIKSVLIYVFEEGKKRTISPEVYFCEDGKIRYQVYEKEQYNYYNPTATYEGSYVVVEPEVMFKKIDLSDVFSFFVDRSYTLTKMATDMNEALHVREDFTRQFEELWNEKEK